MMNVRLDWEELVGLLSKAMEAQDILEEDKEKTLKYIKFCDYSEIR